MRDKIMTLLRDLEKHNQRYLDKEVTLKRFI